MGIFGLFVGFVVVVIIVLPAKHKSLGKFTALVPCNK